MSKLTICDCGHAPTQTTGGGTGYASNADGQTMCYACAHEMALAEITCAKRGDRVTFYVSGDGRRITTWPGDVVMDRVLLGKLHNFSRERHYLSAWDRLGREWTGTGAPGMWATLRLKG